jgi:hypothetical protein
VGWRALWLAGELGDVLEGCCKVVMELCSACELFFPLGPLPLRGEQRARGVTNLVEQLFGQSERRGDAMLSVELLYASRPLPFGETNLGKQLTGHRAGRGAERERWRGELLYPSRPLPLREETNLLKQLR